MMRFMIPLILGATILSCGTPQQTAATVKAVNDTAFATCLMLAPCLPPEARGHLPPEQFCEKLQAVGKLIEFIASQERPTCPAKK